jgi:hypothetical protein
MLQMRRRTSDPGAYDELEFETSIVRGRLDVELLRARAWCEDPQAMCMYADWLLLRALAPDADAGEHAEELVAEARHWLQRAIDAGSERAADMLEGCELRLLDRDLEAVADARRRLMRAAARGDTRSAELLKRFVWG